MARCSERLNRPQLRVEGSKDDNSLATSPLVATAPDEFTEDTVVVDDTDCAANTIVDEEIDETVWDGRGGHRRQKKHTITHYVPRRKESVAPDRGQPVVLINAVSFLAGVFAGALCLAAIQWTSSGGVASQTADFPYTLKPDQYKAAIARLRESFPSQPGRTWKALSGLGSSHLKTANPTQPAVVLLAAYPSAHSTLDCVGKLLALTLTNYSSFTVDSGVIARQASDNENLAKQILGKTLGGKLKDQGKYSPGNPPVILVDSLEKLPAPSPTLFFAYCDSSEAVDPRAVYIFTLHLPESKLDSKASRGDLESEILDYLLHTLWSKTVHEEYLHGTVEALIARISTWVVVVNKEAADATSRGC